MDQYQLFRFFILLWMGMGAGVFLLLLFLTAPYGRHVRSGWGPLISNRTAWIVMETPALYVFILFYLRGEKRFEMVPLICALLWIFHYTYRSIIYPLLMPDGEKKVPLSIILTAITFNVVNTFIQGTYLSRFQTHLTHDWLLSTQFFIGSLLFVMGFFTHFWHDRYLQNLKRRAGSYVVPERGLFTLVSAPNYLGEMVEWLGWAILTWSFAGFSFFFWTFANLFPRAIAHHRWYREHFESYPESRRAVIPFVV